MHTKKDLNRVFVWDKYSDQPYPIKDKKYKKRLYLKNIFSYIKTYFLSIIFFPFALVDYFLKDIQRDKSRAISKDFFALGVDLNRKPKDTLLAINELSINQVLVRFYLSNIKDISNFKKRLDTLVNYSVTIHIIQDREHIENLELLKNSISKVFEYLSPNCSEFVVGNAINRTKWGFFGVDEYLEFYKVVKSVRDSQYRDIKLIGSNMIDFEYHYTIHSLFSFSAVDYDILGTQLYVDRRGDPQNKQIIFNLVDKIELLYSLVKLSRRVNKNKIYITETNWPISNTAPFAPTSEKECVSEDDYMNYMVKYYILAISTGLISRVYWHQLVASGYGLIDIRENFNKRDAFNAYKFMVNTLSDSTFLELNLMDGIYRARFKKDSKNLDVIWALNSKSYNSNAKELYSIDGKLLSIKEIDLKSLFYELN